ncbi:peptidoglycan O-acetyltransferase [Muribaculaceae bacterium]|jgi:alginate O-acetyltransferase complex protein AlgI|nr:MBOAT family protein [Lachnospiraceae bacterium]GFH90184.1 peptidoglycan O-acetyltransferase [Lachnospiraceae bacterium]GFI58632.1 peptidoglycan O-acetyltransferase [Muribaculaceae bacterium]
MIYNSIPFAVFLPIIFILYWICPSKYRYLFLLAASFYFYMYMDPKYIFFLLGTVTVSYLLALALDSARDVFRKKLYLFIGILALIGVLALLKYSGFIIEIAGLPSPAIQFMLPVGISFYTFQTLGYLIDIYRGKYPAERHFGYYCLFVSFFPQILSGPIGRGDVLLPQLKKERTFDIYQASYGMKLMAVGYFKKLVVAGLLAPTVDKIYDNPESYVGLVYIIATFMFALQIYCDFSGYTDIAIGCAKLFGMELSENFKTPYFSRSIKEFWSRWHISLSTWFRDYLYIPLGGNRVGKIRHCFNLMLTFLVSGLWHGAGINYILWGGIHGFYQIIETISGKNKKGREEKRNPLLNLFSVFLTFMAVCLAWVFFRADSVSHAWRIISLSFHEIGNPYNYFRTAVICLDMSYAYMIYLSIPVLLLTIYDYASLKRDVIAWISSRKPWVRYPVYIFLLLIILLFSEKGVSTEFYYFQF